MQCTGVQFSCWLKACSTGPELRIVNSWPVWASNFFSHRSEPEQKVFIIVLISQVTAAQKKADVNNGDSNKVDDRSPPQPGEQPLSSELVDIRSVFVRRNKQTKKKKTTLVLGILVPEIYLQSMRELDCHFVCPKKKPVG